MMNTKRNSANGKKNEKRFQRQKLKENDVKVNNYCNESKICQQKH